MNEELPSIDFSTLVLSLSHSVRMHLGEVPHAENEQIVRSLPMARQSIELLQLLEEKTKGNLTGEEERLLSQTVDELKSRFKELEKGG